MASTEPATIKAFDFVSRHSISYIDTRSERAMQAERPLSGKQAIGASRKYLLRQTSPDTQTLIPTSEATLETSSPSYSITSRPTGGFMNRHPHMVITKHDGGLNIRLAEVRFQMYGYGTIIAYKDAGISETLELLDNHEQRYRFSIDGKCHYWQPLGPSKAVLVLTEDEGTRLALFIYAEEGPQRRSSAPANPMRFDTEEVGEIHIMDEPAGGLMAVDQILCTAVVMVERAKRRATNPGLASWESVSSKVHYPGRRLS